MIAFKHNRIKGTRLYVAIGITTWAIVAMLMLNNQTAFYFIAPYNKYKDWFPRFYTVNFLSSRILLGLTYFFWVYGLLQPVIISSKLKYLILLITICALTCMLQVCCGYQSTLYIALPLFIATFAHLFRRITIVQKNFLQIIKSAHSFPLISGSFLFFAYGISCLILPRFHPFAKYTMFDTFADTTYVYILRDKKGNLMPLQQCSSLSYDAFFTIGETIRQTSAIATISDSLLSESLMNAFKQNIKPKAHLSDTISLHKTYFYLKANTVVTHEKKLGVYATKQFAF